MTQADVGNVLATITKVQQDYPEFADMMMLPGIGAVLFNAAAQGWTPGQVQAAVEQTPYWKSTTAQERSWDLLKATDPATAQRTFNVGAQHAWQVLGKLGVDNLPVETANKLIEWSIRSGWDDSTLTAMAVQAMKGHALPQTGNLGAGMSAVKGAANDYGVIVSPEASFNWASQLAEGKVDQQGVEQYFRNQAINTYGKANPQLADALNRGQTLRQYADPYIQTAAQTLGVSADTVDLSQTKWNRFLTQPGQDGQPMNVSQWQQVIKSDPTYGWQNSADARDTATKASQQILSTFGAL